MNEWLLFVTRTLSTRLIIKCALRIRLDGMVAVPPPASFHYSLINAYNKYSFFFLFRIEVLRIVLRWLYFILYLLRQRSYVLRSGVVKITHTFFASGTGGVANEWFNNIIYTCFFLRSFFVLCSSTDSLENEMRILNMFVWPYVIIITRVRIMAPGMSLIWRNQGQTETRTPGRSSPECILTCITYELRPRIYRKKKSISSANTRLIVYLLKNRNNLSIMT